MIIIIVLPFEKKVDFRSSKMLYRDRWFNDF